MIRVFIHCDLCGSHFDTAMKSIEATRHHATARGWRCQGGRDHCPLCVARGKVAEFGHATGGDDPAGREEGGAGGEPRI